jgi:hypothetical protein
MDLSIDSPLSLLLFASKPISLDLKMQLSRPSGWQDSREAELRRLPPARKGQRRQMVKPAG